MKLYNKSTILFFSIIGSTLFGALLMSDNLKQVGKRNQIIPIIVFAFIWNIFMMKLLNKITIPFLPFLITNLLGGIILIGPIWKHHLQEQSNTQIARKIWGPLLSIIALYMVIIILFLYGFKP